MSDKKSGTIVSIGQGMNKQVLPPSGPIIKIGGQIISSTSKKVVRSVDLVFVIDTTGSMSDKIEGLLATCAKFVDEFAALHLDHQIAVVAFGDLTVPGDKIESTTFVSQVDMTIKNLKNVPRFGGGGNDGESSFEALEQAMNLPFRSNAIKVIIHITDEPALQDRISAINITNRLVQNEILVFVVSPPIGYFKELANKTGGKWYQVSANTDFTDLMEMFQQIAIKVSQVVNDVYRLGNGNVTNYLRLKPPEQ